MIYNAVDRVQERIALHLRVTKTEIHPKPVNGVFNYQCHKNSVQYQSENGGKVIECIYLNREQPILHYINQDSSGEYLETTLGVFCERYEYYQIREVGEKEYLNINDSFDRSLAYWKDTYTRWFERPFIGRVV